MLLTAPVKRVGNSLAIFIPAEKARDAHIKEGDTLRVILQPQPGELFGAFKHLNLGPYSRRSEGMWRDRF